MSNSFPLTFDQATHLRNDFRYLENTIQSEGDLKHLVTKVLITPFEQAGKYIHNNLKLIIENDAEDFLVQRQKQDKYNVYVVLQGDDDSIVPCISLSQFLKDHDLKPFYLNDYTH